MFNEPLLYVLLTPILINAVMTIVMMFFGLFAVTYTILTGKYTFINKIDEWFASDSLAYSLSMITIGIMIAAFIMLSFDFITINIFSIFIGVALYPSTWYLIYLGDVWYNNYKQYKVKKSILTKGSKS
jgi:hypothetical protein